MPNVPKTPWHRTINSKIHSMLWPADFHSFTLLSSCMSFPEDSGSGPGSRPAVLWPQHSRHNGHEQRRLSGPGRGFSGRCRSAVVGIWRSCPCALKPVIRSSVTPRLALRRSRSVVRIYASVRFEPSKINIFVKDCQRGGKDVTCMSASVCFNVTARTPISPTQEVGERKYKLLLYLLFWPK